jgi:hypothetical protein
MKSYLSYDWTLDMNVNAIQKFMDLRLRPYKIEYLCKY